jgi:bacterioferritin
VKGSDKLIETLNVLLAEELTAINQYMVHAEMCENWGYEKLYKAIRGQAMTEMKHAEKLIARILFLEGTPSVSKLNPMSIGKTVDKIVASDLDAEVEAVGAYNEAIRLAVEVKDNGTRDLLSQILKDEEDHVDWLEIQRDQLTQLGLELYLANQSEGASA